MTFSVVIAWRGSTDELRCCLRSLDGQPIDQIIVSRTVEAEFIPGLAEALPQVEWLSAIDTTDLPELFWGALGSVTGDIVGMLESPSVADPRWVDEHRAAHAAQPEVLAVGGPVRPPVDVPGSAVGWYWSEFAAYAPGRESEPSLNLTDANVSYKRAVLARYEAQLAAGYWGWRLRRQCDEGSYFAENAGITYAAPASLAAGLRQRRDNGRSHAMAKRRSGGGHVADLVKAQILPVVLTWRGWRSARRSGWGGAYAAALPWTFLEHCAWAVGECEGYLEGR